MARKPESQSDKQRRSNAKKIERAKQYLSGGGVTREDSDDELGKDDYPWEWVYDNTGKAVEEEGDGIDNEDNIADLLNAEATAQPAHSGRKRKAARKAEQDAQRKIIGARMGDFECKVGDCVLLKAEGTNEAWVGIICEFIEEDDDEMAANFMWFATEKEIRNKEKKRMDFMQNELYICPSWDVNPIASINGKAKVSSAKNFLAKYPGGRIPRGSKEHGKSFFCRRGCNTRTATYTEEFNWEDIFKGTDEDIFNLIERVKNETKASRKRRGELKAIKAQQEQEFLSVDDGDDHGDDFGTPKKRRKTSVALTPKKPRTPSKVLLTPSHKRIIVKKPLEFTPLGTRVIAPDQIYASPFQLARSKLHVAAVPTTLPCRENEFSEVYSHLESAITDGSGACIYISGTPGTGKTATVREVVSQLNASVEAEELDDFIFVEINGMKVTDPHQSYSLLWEALKGDRVSPSQALDLLEREFNHPSPRRIPCVVLMDELDQLVTKNQSVMYNFFNWPGLRHSRLIVLAVANTMDLPERTLSNKISSRLGLTRITFPGYNHEQLMKIIESRLEGVPGGVVESDAVQFASRKVAAVSGDARRALDICRRAVELAETEAGEAVPQTPSKKSAGPNGAVKKPSLGKVTIATIKRAIQEATTSPLQQHLRGLPLASKLLLASLLARIRRTGLGESFIGEVIEEAKRISKMAVETETLEFLLTEISPTAVGGTALLARENLRDAPRVHAMGTAAIELMEAGIIGFEARKGDRVAKVRLCIGEGDVKLALKDDPEARGLGF
ncbi:hypothetical protein V497_02621 [Pseudogymnoascus sp. VKM F-4516 (FW-969)]|nr:hypothetical protein V490_02195 [Pseudogymnoascus sp. VKM F-3557]KFY62026.1 hypothetical protein V497_02621 [Pseudogymnoascus sp. VKM F-4516 (FW-969)]